jgi:hypothetical protein
MLLGWLGIAKVGDHYQVYNEQYGGYFWVTSPWIALRIRLGI